jgi:predicted HTH domain antitoxin
MQITAELPDDLAAQLFPEGQDPSRAALENIAVEAFRAKRLTEHQLATLLGMDRYTLDGFLKQRAIWYDYTIEDLNKELEIHRKLGL